MSVVDGDERVAAVEVADHAAANYLSASGSTDQERHRHRELTPGETFETTPARVAATPGRHEHALVPLTEYRRPNGDDRRCPTTS